MNNIVNDEHHIVTTSENFDELLFDENHPARSKNDTYYLDKDNILRTHMTSREKFYISSGLDNFILYGKIFRKDEIDKSHFPVFHQLEGVKLFNSSSIDSSSYIPENNSADNDEIQKEYAFSETLFIIKELKDFLYDILKNIFGNNINIRWPNAFFPFTSPSFEAEILYEGSWLEVLGAGMLQKRFLDTCFGSTDHSKSGWAFGLGLERLAMILFNIPDIRWFWSTDERFLNQFREGQVTKFKTFSNHPPAIRDLSFWINDESGVYDNDIFDIIRLASEDKVDNFIDPISKKKSKCFRIIYRSISGPLNGDQINSIQERIKNSLSKRMKIEHRS